MTTNKGSEMVSEGADTLVKKGVMDETFVWDSDISLMILSVLSVLSESYRQFMTKFITS